MNMIVIKETKKEDLNNIMSLWNDGEVMHYVGFPGGLGISLEKLSNWLKSIENQRPMVNHYSIYHQTLRYCGETFYRILANGYIVVDIKLFKKARGQGIAYFSLKKALNDAFCQGGKIAFVDPNIQNKKAIQLYQRLGFREMPYPDFYIEEKSADNIFMALNALDFKAIQGD